MSSDSSGPEDVLDRVPVFRDINPPDPAPRSKGPGLWIIAFALFAIALGARLVPALHAFHPTPDAVEYLLVSRSLKDGKGLTLPLRSFYEAPGQPPMDDLEHPSEHERSPLLSLLILPLAGSTGQAAPPMVQLLPAMFAALAAALAGALAFECAQAEGLGAPQCQAAALLAGLGVATYGPLFWVSVRLLTEPLALCLMMAGFWPLLRAQNRDLKGLAPPALSAAAASLMLWARPEALLLGAVLAVFWSLRSRRQAGCFVMLWGLALAGLWARNLSVHGRLMATQSMVLQVLDDQRLHWRYQASSPEVWSSWAVASRILFNLKRCLVVGFEPRNSSFFGLFMILSLRQLAGLWRLENWRQGRLGLRQQLILWALLSLMLKVCVWSIHDPRRFAIPLVAFLQIAAAVEMQKFMPESLEKLRLWLLVAVVFIAVGPGVRIAKRQRRRDDQNLAWSNPDLRALKAEFRGLEGSQRVAAVNPWSVTLETGEPSLLLPIGLKKPQLLNLLRRFRVTALWLSPQAQHPGIPEPVHYQQWLVEAGWQRVSLGHSLLFKKPN